MRACLACAWLVWTCVPALGGGTFKLRQGTSAYGVGLPVLFEAVCTQSKVWEIQGSLAVLTREATPEELADVPVIRFWSPQGSSRSMVIGGRGGFHIDEPYVRAYDSDGVTRWTLDTVAEEGVQGWHLGALMAGLFCGESVGFANSNEELDRVFKFYHSGSEVRVIGPSGQYVPPQGRHYRVGTAPMGYVLAATYEVRDGWTVESVGDGEPWEGWADLLADVESIGVMMGSQVALMESMDTTLVEIRDFASSVEGLVAGQEASLQSIKTNTSNTVSRLTATNAALGTMGDSLSSINGGVLSLLEEVQDLSAGEFGEVVGLLEDIRGYLSAGLMESIVPDINDIERDTDYIGTEAQLIRAEAEEINANLGTLLAEWQGVAGLAVPGDTNYGPVLSGVTDAAGGRVGVRVGDARFGPFASFDPVGDLNWEMPNPFGVLRGGGKPLAVDIGWVVPHLALIHAFWLGLMTLYGGSIVWKELEVK